MLQALLVWRWGSQLRGSLLLFGKLGDPGRLNAVAARLLVHIVDSSNNRRYLVDKGRVTASFHTSLLYLQLDPSFSGQVASQSDAGENMW